MQPTTFTHDLAIVIGRMQIPHMGHAGLMEAAGELAPKVLVIFDSAFQSRDPRNPFTWEERAEMVPLSVKTETKDRLTFAPIQEKFDNAAWANDVEEAVRAHSKEGARVVLVGHRKDATSDYIDLFPNFDKIEVPLTHNVHASDLRNAYFSQAYINGALSPVHDFVSKDVSNYLLAWSNSPEYKQRAIEHQAIIDYKARWSPRGDEKHLTADAMIVCAGKLLLQQRSGVIGYGLWGLPGGFRNPGEEPIDAALRELDEETGLVLSPEEIQDCFVASAVFGHSLRSPRGHIETEAFYFDLGDTPLPIVIPAVDKDGYQESMDVKWVDINEVLTKPELLFEDHGRIIGTLQKMGKISTLNHRVLT